MATWTTDELTRIGAAEELQISSHKRDGTLRAPVIIWVVRHGDDLVVRSVNGRDASWFRGTRVRHEGRMRAGGVEKDVTFAEVDHSLDEAIDEAYRAKYRRYSGQYVDPMVAAEARAATIRLLPR